MPVLLGLIVTAVVAFGLGVAIAPLWLALFHTSTTILTPFFILSLAILVLSIAYAIRTLRRPPPR